MFRSSTMVGVVAVAMVGLLPHAALAGAVAANGPVQTEFSSLVYVQVDPVPGVVTGVFTTRFYPGLFGNNMTAQSTGEHGGVVTFVTPLKDGSKGQIGASILDAGTSTLGSGGNSLVSEDLRGVITTSTDPRLKVGVGQIYVQSYGNAAALNYTTFGTWGAKKRFHDGSPIYAGAFAGASPGATFVTTMPTSGSAAYTGHAVGVVNAGGHGLDWLGTISLTANFAAMGGTLSGAIANIGVYKNGTTLVGSMNDIVFNTGTFSRKAFYGTLSAGLTAGTAANLTGGRGTYKGAFYGPNAAEVAGIIDFSATNVHLTGSFGAKQ